jgi:MinD superfamily P-loop ATPase
VGRIPYDTAGTHAMVAGKSIVEFSDDKVSNAIKGIWHKVEQTLKG